MLKSRSIYAAAVLAALTASVPVDAQDRRARIDVDQYTIDAEISPSAQTLTAHAMVRFTPFGEDASTATFELNNALTLAKVTDDQGRNVNFSRNASDHTVRLMFDSPLKQSQQATLIFDYSGRLTGNEESPIYGIRFAAIHPDYAYLMYPSRWFPVSGYTTDRFAANLNITVPDGYRVLGSANAVAKADVGKQIYGIQYTQSAFPGSIAVVKGDPVSVRSAGATSAVYFRDTETAMANAYGNQFGTIVQYLAGDFGTPPTDNFTLVETEAGAPSGYSAPGMVFLNPRAIGTEVNMRLLANHAARQWFEQQISPATRNHLWITNGMALYSEALWVEHEKSKAAANAILKDLEIEALTQNDVPLAQSSRLEDYSPEYWALTGSKGATVFRMLRSVIGDDKFFAAIKKFATENVGKSVTTDDLRKAVDTVTGDNLQYFFIEWIESSGAPEFKTEYTIFRTQKGFRITGKITQDLDTFRMPVDLHIETEGNPEDKTIEVAGTASDFSVETFGKPTKLTLDPDNEVLRYGPQIRVAVAIRKGEQFAETGQYAEALNEYQRALETNRNSSLAHYRVAEAFFRQNNYQAAANAFREALDGDLEPKWIEVWTHINLGKIFDITGQRDRAITEYNKAQRTRDNTQGAQDEVARYLQKPFERKRNDY